MIHYRINILPVKEKEVEAEEEEMYKI